MERLVLGHDPYVLRAHGRPNWRVVEGATQMGHLWVQLVGVIRDCRGDHAKFNLSNLPGRVGPGFSWG